MSGINGDKSRFHRERKSKIARRVRNREAFKNAKTQTTTVASAAPSAAKAVKS
jgi:hypothetical protein